MATSKKSSSRKSSSRKSSLIKNSNDATPSNNYVGTILSLILNIFIIYYLLNLEDKTCNCIRDWRHNYIKITTIFNIILSSLILFGLIKQSTFVGFTNINIIMLILAIINLYAFYTYIGDLDATKCECAVSKQKNLHNFLNIYRYIIVFLLFILIILFVLIQFIQII
jgi:hypothetical protein